LGNKQDQQEPQPTISSSTSITGYYFGGCTEHVGYDLGKLGISKSVNPCGSWQVPLPLFFQAGFWQDSVGLWKSVGPKGQPCYLPSCQPSQQQKETIRARSLARITMPNTTSYVFEARLAPLPAAHKHPPLSSCFYSFAELLTRQPVSLSLQRLSLNFLA